MKTCTKCKVEKSLSEFGKQGSRHRSWCKKCSSKANSDRLKERTLTESGFREEKAAKSSQWREANPNARQTHYQNNKIKEREQNRKWIQQNRPWTTDEKKAYLKKWREDNKDLKNSYERNRQHAKRANGGSVTHQEWLDVCSKYGNVCLKCGSDKVTMDHVIPLSKGGKHSAENLQPLCGSCNASKGTKIIDYRS